MALVECELCDWAAIVEEDEDQSEEDIFAQCALVFARHMVHEHPLEARLDPISRAYIRSIAAHQARTS